VPITTTPLRGEIAALPEDALTTSALSFEPRSQVLAGLPESSQSTPGTARVSLGGAIPPREEGKWFGDTFLKGLETSLKVTRDACKRYGTKEGREEDALKKAFQEAFVELVKAQGKGLVEKAPFGKVILVTFDLSVAFADGVGESMVRASAEIRAEGDKFFRSHEIGEDLSAFRAASQPSGEAVRRLNRILADGLIKVADKAVEMVLKKLGEIPGKVLGDVAGQIANHLVRQNDLLAIFNETVRAASGSIPEGRGKVERLAFHFVSSVFLDQMADKELQAKLAGLPDVVKKGPVDVNLLASVIQILAQGSYDTYARHVNVAYVQTEAKQLLIENARKLASGLVGVELESSQSGDVEVAPNRIGVPATWLPSLLETEETRVLMRERWGSREAEFRDYLLRVKMSLDLRRMRYQRRWRPYAPRGDMARWAALQDQWVDDWRKARQEAREVIQAIVEEFGEAWASDTIRIHLEFGIDEIVGYEREVPLFAPRP
jgi:hypothetical protein